MSTARTGAEVVPISPEAQAILDAVAARQAGGPVGEIEAVEPPAGLSQAAKQIHRIVTSTYDLELGELMLLEIVCQSRTTLDELEEAYRSEGSPALAEGYMGKGTIIHPLVSEIRMARTAYLQALKALALPIEGEYGGRKKPGPARKSPESRRRRNHYPDEQN